MVIVVYLRSKDEHRDVFIITVELVMMLLLVDSEAHWHVMKRLAVINDARSDD